MSRNVLSELRLGYQEIMNEDVYDIEVRKSFLKVVTYVRNATWTKVETARFLAYHFRLNQVEVAELWNAVHEEKKVDSTFRVQAQSINEYLCRVFPQNWLERYIAKDKEQIEEMDDIIDALKLNDTHIEIQLGEALLEQLKFLQPTVNKYTPEQCKHELQVVKRLSKAYAEKLIQSCDMDKLSFVVDTMLCNSVKNGKINEVKFSFIQAYQKIDKKQ